MVGFLFCLVLPGTLLVSIGCAYFQLGVAISALVGALWGAFVSLFIPKNP